MVMSGVPVLGRVSREGSLGTVVWVVVVVVRYGKVPKGWWRLWWSWSGGAVSSLVWGRCREFEAFRSVWLAEPEAGESGAIVVP